MSVVWRLGWILFGFAAATLTAAISHAPPASAQEYEPATRRDAGSLKGAASDALDSYETAPKRPSQSAESADDTGAPASDSADAGGQDDPASGASPSEADSARDPSEGPASAEPSPDDGLTPADGVIDVSEPQAPEGATDPTRDTRPPADTEIFDNPPAGYDPLLFQIEDIDPIETDRRPARLFRLEPYDPIGIRIGSFILFPEAEFAGFATNNVLSSPDARSDKAGEISTKTRLVSNWAVHALELRATTYSTFYDEFSSEDDRAWDAEARGRVDITGRTNLQGLARHDVSQEQRSAIDANQVGNRAQITTDRAELAFNHRFNRLAVQLRGSVSDTTYSETDGFSNADRDTLETRQAVRASWEFKPTLAVFAEQELNQREKDAAPADGIPRDSEGTRTRVGLDFGATGAILRGTISVGYGRQTPDDHILEPVNAFLLDANLAWRPTEITSFLLTAQSDIFETTTELSGGVVSHQVGLEARHAIRRYLIAQAGLAYTAYDYSHSSLEESALTSFLGAEYYASPEIVLFGRYEHLSFASNTVDGDYDSDEIRLGVRVRK